MLLENLLGVQTAISTKSISGDYSLEAGFNRVEVDATLGNITITLPIISNAFKYRNDITIKRIDDSLNTLTINGTSSNYEDEGIVLFGLEATKIYASNAGIWRAAIQ